MKKVGIITFHRAMNCGAMLQALALQKTLSKKYDTEIIDYRCDKIEKTYGYKRSVYNVLKEIAKLMLRPVSTISVYNRRHKFKQFIKKYYIISKKYTKKNIYEANKVFDAIVAGSDQIWNPKWSGDDWNYFLEFADNSKKYSYSASFGGSDVDDKYRDRIINDLMSFKSLLLRESSGYDFVSSIKGNAKVIDVTCDPVLLLTREEWDELVPVRKKADNYILIYFAAPQTNSVEFAKLLSQRTGKRVVYFNSFFSKNLDDTFDNIISVGPSEFLSYIRYADLVITTSFHAMAFSIIYNVPFYYELSNRKHNNNSRLEHLARVFEVENRNLEQSNRQLDFDINWKSINNKLDIFRQQSKNVLFSSLRCIDNEEIKNS